MRSAIWLGDLIDAVAALAPRGDDPLAIARVLGLAAPAEAPVVRDGAVGKAAVGAATVTVRTAAGTNRADASLSATSSSSSSTTTASTISSTGTGPVTLQPLGRRAGDVPAWLEDDGQRLPLGPASRAPVAIEPLFEPRRHRALVSAALATRAPDGPIDLERAIEQIAARRLGASLPRLDLATLRRGAWLLLDRTPAMAPFFADVTDLAARIERVVGRELVRVQRFTTGPLAVWDDDLLDEVPVALPPPGTPLVAITDLGLRAGADRSWRTLFERLRGRSPAIAIVPYPRARWPRSLRERGLATIVPWDRGTGVGDVRVRAKGRR